jgi:hypothetical protein
MITKQMLRGFKSWVQYQAEKLGITESEMLKRRKEEKDGAFEFWKQEVKNSHRLNFIADHCTPEEQKLYLSEFSTEELGRYLIKEVRQLSNKDLQKIIKLPVRHHRLPIISGFYKLRAQAKISEVDSNEILTQEQKLWRFAKESLKNKLKELEWRKIDHEIASR